MRSRMVAFRVGSLKNWTKSKGTAKTLSMIIGESVPAPVAHGLVRISQRHQFRYLFTRESRTYVLNQSGKCYGNRARWSVKKGNNQERTGNQITKNSRSSVSKSVLRKVFEKFLAMRAMPPYPLGGRGQRKTLKQRGSLNILPGSFGLFQVSVSAVTSEPDAKHLTTADSHDTLLMLLGRRVRHTTCSLLALLLLIVVGDFFPASLQAGYLQLAARVLYLCGNIRPRLGRLYSQPSSQGPEVPSHVQQEFPPGKGGSPTASFCTFAHIHKPNFYPQIQRMF